MNENVALVVRSLDQRELAEFSEERIGLIARTVAPSGTTADELALFLTFCKATGLNPLRRQVYMMKAQGRVSIITGIDGLRLIAQRTGEYEGQEGPEWKATADSPWSDVPPDDFLYACRVGVWRKGFRKPLWSTVLLSSFMRNDSSAVNWRDRPEHMLAIRAESHALRRAFPAEMAGLNVSYDDSGEETPPVIVNPDAPLTNAQLGELHRLSRDLNFTDRERHSAAGVASFTELTKGQAAELIDGWRIVLESRGEPGGHRPDDAQGDDVPPAPARSTVEAGSPAGDARRAHASSTVEAAVGDPAGSGSAVMTGEPERAVSSPSEDVGGGSSMGKGGPALPDTSEAVVARPAVDDPVAAQTASDPTSGAESVPDGSPDRPTSDQHSPALSASDTPRTHEPRGPRSTRRQPAPPNPEPSATENAGITATGAASLSLPEACPKFTGSDADMAACERVVDGVVCGWPRSYHGRQGTLS